MDMKLEALPHSGHLAQRLSPGQLTSIEPLKSQSPWPQSEPFSHPSATNPVRWGASAPIPSPPARAVARPFNPPLGTAVPDPDAKKPPRPPNAWILYRSDCIKKQREARSPDAPKPTQAELSKLFGEQWRNEAEDVKAEYERQAEVARDEHTAKYPDWRFSRKPLKPGFPGPNESASISPKHKSSKLQGPARGGAVKKRRRNNTSGASSDPPSPHDTSTRDSTSPGYGYQQAHLPPGVPPDQFARSPFPFPSVLASASSSRYSFPQMPESTSATTNSSSQQPDTYRQYLQQDGLESTLAQRNTSAAQFYNIYEMSPRSNHVNGGRPNTAHAERGLGDSHASAFPFNGSTSAPHDGGHFGFYIDDHNLQFDPSSVSLPNMPFGMPLQDPSGEQPQSANGVPRWFQTQSPGPQSNGQGSIAIDPALARPVGFEYPDWLFALQDVRVRQDDYVGIPLLDFFNDLRLRAGQRQVEPNAFSPSSLPYSFP